MLWRIRWKIPQLIGPWSTNDGERGGSFRSRQSVSSAATTEFAGEQNESLVTNHTEVGLGSPVMTDVPYRLRRSRTRWLDDYGQENELDSSGSNDAVDTSTVTCKLKRGRCFIRCSPEKWGLRCTQVDLPIGDSKSNRPLKNSCERCWHNPETPHCDLCIASGKKERQQSGPIYTRAIIEKPPKQLVLPFIDNSLVVCTHFFLLYFVNSRKQIAASILTWIQLGVWPSINNSPKFLKSTTTCDPIRSQTQKTAIRNGLFESRSHLCTHLRRLTYYGVKRSLAVVL